MAQDWFSYAFFIYSQPSFLLEITILVITCILKFKIFLQMNQIYYKVLDKYEKIYMEAQAEPQEPPKVNNSGEIRRRLHKLIKDGSKGIYNEEEKSEVKKLIYEDLSSKKLVLKDDKKLKNGAKGGHSKYQNKEVKKRLQSIIDGIDTGSKWRKILKCVPVQEGIGNTSRPENNTAREYKADASNDRELLFETKEHIPKEDLAKRVEKLLSTTPSEYVRKDVERIRREMHRAQKNPLRHGFKEICYEKKAIERFKFYRDND